ncbi:DegV family protein [Deinococcus wulumuqiensis]|uniref:DegV family protein n=1 Tax=Deinococcus wulumuqiensis TaxID=980427 RepID=UPI00242F896C|nr:DegV family protein [Deinococcus wulumuqiensis]
MLTVTTESTADILPLQLGYSGIQLLPVPLGHQGRVYSERELPPDQLVNLIRATGEPARTLPVPDEAVARTFEAALQSSRSGRLVHVASGSRFTPHYEVAARVAERFGGRVQVIDGGTVSYALGVQALHAAHLADQGADSGQIGSALSELRERTLLTFAVESLDFLRVNGRIGNVAAFIGSWLGLRPVLAVEAGEVVNKSRVRGQDAAVRTLLSATHQFQRQTGETLRLYCGHTIGGEGGAGQLQAQLQAVYGNPPAPLHPLGSGLTANVGPGTVAVLAFPRRFGLGYA